MSYTSDIRQADATGNGTKYSDAIIAAREKAEEFVKAVQVAKEAMNPRFGEEPIYRILEEAETMAEILRLEYWRATGGEGDFLEYLKDNSHNVQSRDIWRKE